MSRNAKIYLSLLIIIENCVAPPGAHSVASPNIMMQVQTKLFRSENTRDRIVMVARGVLNIAGFHQIFVEVTRLTEHQSACEVLVDLVDATYDLQASQIDDLIGQTSWSHEQKIALVAARSSEHFNQLSVLSACLLKHGFQAAVFYDGNVAIDWLRHRAPLV